MEQYKKKQTQAGYKDKVKYSDFLLKILAPHCVSLKLKENKTFAMKLKTFPRTTLTTDGFITLESGIALEPMTASNPGIWAKSLSNCLGAVDWSQSVKPRMSFDAVLKACRTAPPLPV